MLIAEAPARTMWDFTRSRRERFMAADSLIAALQQQAAGQPSFFVAKVLLYIKM
jgi:hypothetical protein